MNDNDKIAMEIQEERARAEREKSKPRKPSSKQVEEARYMWMGGAAVVDLLTAWLIYQETTYWYYALIWVLAGAGGLLWSERLKERIGKNREQTKIADNGVTVSAAAIVIMALVVGTVWVLRINVLWMNALQEISALVLFFFHLFQSYQYHQKDDEIQAADEEARLEAQNERAIREAHRAARLVESKKVKSGYENSYRAEHGAAFDAALGLDIEQVNLKRNGAADPTKGER